jgi:hypothetical protein
LLIQRLEPVGGSDVLDIVRVKEEYDEKNIRGGVVSIAFDPAAPQPGITGTGDTERPENPKTRPEAGP